ncbi:MAG: hypothetical protein QXL94_05615 [Candidatus Parvarchaeum sp.]
MVTVKVEKESGVKYVSQGFALNGVYLNEMSVTFLYYKFIKEGVVARIRYDFEPGTYFLYALKRVLEYSLVKNYLDFYENEQSTDKAELYALQKVFGHNNFEKSVEE